MSRSWQPAEKDVIHRILLSSLQVLVERNGDRFRTASGVVIAARPATPGVDCFVLTSGHAFAGLSDAHETYVVLDRHRGSGVKARAAILAQRDTEEFDLGLLRVRTGQCIAAPPGRSPALGDPIWIVGFPWGRHIRLAGGNVSQLTPDDPGGPRTGSRLMVDASVAYGVSGAGVFDARTGSLVGLVEGYGTARVSFGQNRPPLYIDVPVPGETYVTSLATIERFLHATGQADLLETHRSSAGDGVSVAASGVPGFRPCGGGSEEPWPDGRELTSSGHESDCQPSLRAEADDRERERIGQSVS